ncbi:hypothetical protein EB061_13525, partial [bacterium]|nr:hypothetical protein [bacterium]
LLSMSDHELFEAASAKRKLSDGNNWSRVGACLQNDASQCVSCACTSYTQTNYANPTGYNGLPYSPTVPGTGCASLKFNPPDVITCWPGWSELGLCPSQNRGLEKLVANQMRVALKNSSADVCKLKEYILLAGLEDEDRKEEEQPNVAATPVPVPVDLAVAPVVSVIPSQPAPAPKYSVVSNDAKPVESQEAPVAFLPDQVVAPVVTAPVIKPEPKPVSAPAPRASISNPKPAVNPARATRSGLVMVQETSGAKGNSLLKCGVVFVGPAGVEGLIPMTTQRCASLSSGLKSKAPVTPKQAETLYRAGSFSERSLQIADQKCNAGISRYRDYIGRLGLAIT